MTLDLWAPQVEDEQLHPNFKACKIIHSEITLGVVTGWSEGFADRDNKIVKEFQTSFDSSFWELYLHAVFKELGYCPKFGHPSPDFDLHHPTGDIVAEATVASHASGTRPEWDKLGEIFHNNETIHQKSRRTAIRLSNAITSKYKKYIEKYSEYPHVKGKPFVLCLTAFDSPYSFDWSLEAIRTVLFGIERPMFETDEDGNNFPIGHSEATHLIKDNGSLVPVGMFRSNDFSSLSAIIFSNTATSGKASAISPDQMPDTTFFAHRYNEYGSQPLTIAASKPHYRETLLDGLTVFVNTFAPAPFDIRPFLGREVAVEMWSRLDDVYVPFVPHEWLIRRFSQTIRPTGELSGYPDPRAAVTSHMPKPPPRWPERKLIPVVAQVGLAINNHMAHVGEWTVVVFQCSIDETWHAIASRATVHSIPEFRDATRDEEIASIFACLNDHDSIEDAFEHVCREIGAQPS